MQTLTKESDMTYDTGKTESIRVHRVGSITAGISLIAFGIVFLIQLFTDALDYATVLSLWPLVLIGLGVEVLMSNVRFKELKYDKGAVAILLLMMIFASCMAVTSEVMRYITINNI